MEESREIQLLQTTYTHNRMYERALFAVWLLTLVSYFCCVEVNVLFLGHITLSLLWAYLNSYSILAEFTLVTITIVPVKPPYYTANI